MIIIKLRFPFPRHRWPQPILAIMFRLFGFFARLSFKLFGIPLFDFQRTEWSLFQRRVVRTQLDINLLITNWCWVHEVHTNTSFYTCCIKYRLYHLICRYINPYINVVPTRSIVTFISVQVIDKQIKSELFNERNYQTMYSVYNMNDTLYVYNIPCKVIVYWQM